MEATTLFGVQIFDLEDVVVTVEEYETTVRKKPFTAKLYRREGLAKYIEPDGREYLADEATFYDSGPDGVSRGYTKHKDVEPTEEERAENRRKLQKIVTQCMVRQGFW